MPYEEVTSHVIMVISNIKSLNNEWVIDVKCDVRF